MNVEDEIVLLQKRLEKLTAAVEAIQSQLADQKAKAAAPEQPLGVKDDSGEDASDPEGDQ